LIAHRDGTIGPCGAAQEDVYNIKAEMIEKVD
jgi:hypothetical protein